MGGPIKKRVKTIRINKKGGQNNCLFFITWACLKFVFASDLDVKARINLKQALNLCHNFMHERTFAKNKRGNIYLCDEKTL